MTGQEMFEAKAAENDEFLKNYKSQDLTINVTPEVKYFANSQFMIGFNLGRSETLDSFSDKIFALVKENEELKDRIRELEWDNGISRLDKETE